MSAELWLSVATLVLTAFATYIPVYVSHRTNSMYLLHIERSEKKRVQVWGFPAEVGTSFTIRNRGWKGLSDIELLVKVEDRAGKLLSVGFYGDFDGDPNNYLVFDVNSRLKRCRIKHLNPNKRIELRVRAEEIARGIAIEAEQRDFVLVQGDEGSISFPTSIGLYLYHISLVVAASTFLYWLWSGTI